MKKLFILISILCSCGSGGLEQGTYDLKQMSAETTCKDDLLNYLNTALGSVYIGTPTMKIVQSKSAYTASFEDLIFDLEAIDTNGETNYSGLVAGSEFLNGCTLVIKVKITMDEDVTDLSTVTTFTPNECETIGTCTSNQNFSTTKQ